MLQPPSVTIKERIDNYKNNYKTKLNEIIRRHPCYTQLGEFAKSIKLYDTNQLHARLIVASMFYIDENDTSDIVTQSIPAAIIIAYNYFHAHKYTDISFEDMAQNAICGLYAIIPNFVRSECHNICKLKSAEIEYKFYEYIIKNIVMYLRPQNSYDKYFDTDIDSEKSDTHDRYVKICDIIKTMPTINGSIIPFDIIDMYIGITRPPISKKDICLIYKIQDAEATSIINNILSDVEKQFV